jgi:hypothetical protein
VGDIGAAVDNGTGRLSGRTWHPANDRRSALKRRRSPLLLRSSPIFTTCGFPYKARIGIIEQPLPEPSFVYIILTSQKQGTPKGKNIRKSVAL